MDGDPDKRRFDRCLTPMGTVPISVIYGFKYPMDKKSKTPPDLLKSAPQRGAAAAVTSSSPSWPSSLYSPNMVNYFISTFIKQILKASNGIF